MLLGKLFGWNNGIPPSSSSADPEGLVAQNDGSGASRPGNGVNDAIPESTAAANRKRKRGSPQGDERRTHAAAGPVVTEQKRLPEAGEASSVTEQPEGMKNNAEPRPSC